MTEKEELQKLVKECSSFSDILRKQGKAISGTSLKILKEKLKTYEIPHHFVVETRGGKIAKKSISELLVKNSNHKSQNLKRRLIQEGYKEDKCEICGQTNIWNGKTLVLQVDHINGDHYDNRLENLRIVCPNCHTQTDTFASKKSKKEYRCVDCGQKVNYKSTRCLKCSAIDNAKRKQKNSGKQYPTKEELEKLILEKSFEEIGRMYDVQGNAVKKWCIKHNLPSRKVDIKKLYFNQEYTPLQTVKCDYCGKEFKQEERTSRFCCKECYKNYIAEHGSLERNHNYSNLQQVTKEKILELKDKGFSFTKTAKELNISRKALEWRCNYHKIPIWKRS